MQTCFKTELRSQSSLCWVVSGLALTAPGQLLSPAFYMRMDPRSLLNTAPEMMQPHSFSVWPEYFSPSGRALSCVLQPVALGMRSTDFPRTSHIPALRLGLSKQCTGL